MSLGGGIVAEKRADFPEFCPVIIATPINNDNRTNKKTLTSKTDLQ